jgi:hypothetical protein
MPPGAFTGARQDSLTCHQLHNRAFDSIEWVRRKTKLISRDKFAEQFLIRVYTYPKVEIQNGPRKFGSFHSHVV